MAGVETLQGVVLSACLLRWGNEQRQCQRVADSEARPLGTAALDYEMKYRYTVLGFPPTGTVCRRGHDAQA